jgi:hypothetical protein
MNINLSGLDSIVKSDTPTDYEFLLFLFFERGISLREFNELPIPYIISMSKTDGWVREKQAKANKPKR